MNILISTQTLPVGFYFKYFIFKLILTDSLITCECDDDSFFCVH